ncbi:MAG: NlpC/P60 family protein [Candidatus Aminicenantes bacterium]|nr:NlpC/P60 family protein [Candidatus Aminicenantes bacterium]
MKTVLKKGGLILTVLGLAWFSGCRAAVRVIPQPMPPAAVETVARMGYTVQAGAFSVLDNARTLTRALNAQGLDAYYFPDEAGLYKVRFGDFPSRDAAVREAGRLMDKALIQDYFIVGAEDYSVPKQSQFGEDEFRQKLVATAERFVGAEYSWGGASSRDGFDCSGLARAIYQLNGLSLPRSSAEQYRAGTAVPRDRLLKGDLVFFAASRNRAISHVGIYVGETAFIHAPGKDRKIRKDSLDASYFKEHFSGARTYLK